MISLVALACNESNLVLTMLLLEECEQWEEWFEDAEIQTTGAVESVTKIGFRRIARPPRI